MRLRINGNHRPFSVFPSPETIERNMVVFDSAAIFAKDFSEPLLEKSAKIIYALWVRGSQCLRLPQPSCYPRFMPNKGHKTGYAMTRRDVGMLCNSISQNLNVCYLKIRSIFSKAAFDRKLTIKIWLN